VGDLEAAHRQAVEKDRQAEADFAQGKGRKLPPPVAPDAEAAVEQARRELELLERELPASADRLFAAAHPNLEDALRQLERLLDADDDAVEAAISEALRRLDERAQLAREGHWIGLAMWESAISPYDAHASGGEQPGGRRTSRKQLAEVADAAGLALIQLAIAFVVTTRL
jgi:hypothetical protein